MGRLAWWLEQTMGKSPDHATTLPFLTSRLLSTGRIPRHPQEPWLPGGTNRRAPRTGAERSESQKGGGAYFRPTPRP
jgi:hypothetical protein